MGNDKEHPNAVKCGSCEGSGDCKRCGGKGRLPGAGLKFIDCNRCGGTGICPGCNGSGWIIIPMAK
mgnify:CR=1 FL=1